MVVESYTALREAIQVRRLDDGYIVTTEAIAHIIRTDEEYITLAPAANAPTDAGAASALAAMNARRLILPFDSSLSI